MWTMILQEVSVDTCDTCGSPRTLFQMRSVRKYQQVHVEVRFLHLKTLLAWSCEQYMDGQTEFESFMFL